MTLLGLQFLLWSLSGLYMVAMDIDFIHGDHLVKAPTPVALQSKLLLTFQEILQQYPQAERLKLTQLAKQSVYQFSVNGNKHLVSATSGDSLLPFTAAVIKKLVSEQSNNLSDTRIKNIRFLTDRPPAELSSRHLPVWQVTYDDFSENTLYISSTTGQVITKRHNYWRFFDFVWMLHIMDYENREDITNWLLFIFSLTGIFSCFSGLYLIGHRFRFVAKFNKRFINNKKQLKNMSDYATPESREVRDNA